MLFVSTICSMVARSLKEFREVVCEHNLQYGGRVSKGVQRSCLRAQSAVWWPGL